MKRLLASLLVISMNATAENPAPACDMARWEPFITEAATRFEIPALWIRAVIRAESAGCEHLNNQSTTSEVGAMGLMQLMPGTWREYRERLGLGANAYDPRDNILAGAAYLRDLYNRYGWPGAAPAYHAGPQRYEASLTHAKPLPAATLDYLARIDRAMASNPARATPSSVQSPSKPNALFVELRHRNEHSKDENGGSPDVQDP